MGDLRKKMKGIVFSLVMVSIVIIRLNSMPWWG